MKWMAFRVRTKADAEDIIISSMQDIGLYGAQIEDHVPLTAAEKEQMYQLELLRQVFEGTAAITAEAENGPVTIVPEGPRKDIKRAIMAFGGVTCALSDVPANYTEAGGTYTMIGSDSDDMSHAGVLIGWDDDFPKENFARTASQDGAWLVQNSYSAAWGDGGFYWVSYDTPLSDLHRFFRERLFR